MYDIIIIGAGPAGMTSALYSLRANKKVLVIEKKCYGGQIINASIVENYPGIMNISGFNFANNLYKQIKDLGAEIKIEEVKEITKDKVVKTNKRKYYAKSIIITTGTLNRKLLLDNEDRLIGKGISYCATCDGNFYKNKDVAVVGGGNTALEDALYLSNVASKVYLIHRNNNFRGEKIYLDELRNKDNVEIITNSKVTKIVGNEYLEKIIINDKDEIILNGLFIAIGQVPNNSIFENILDIQDGYIITDEKLHTNVDGIFCAGDARNKDLRQLTTAVADGSIAATEAIKYLNNL